MKLLLHCSWPGQVEWWCETLQLHSEKLLCQFKGGTEADKRSFLPPLPPCPALWRKLWLWDFELEVLHLHVRENSEKISWGIFTLFLFFGSSFGYLLRTWILKAFLRAMCAAYIDYHVILIMFYYVILSEGYIMLYYHYHFTLSCLFWLSCWICSAKINGQKSLTKNHWPQWSVISKDATIWERPECLSECPLWSPLFLRWTICLGFQTGLGSLRVEPRLR